MTTLQTIREITIRGRTEGIAQATGELNAMKTAHEGVARGTETTTRATLSVERAMDRWQRTLDTTYRAEQTMAKVTRDLDRALEQGAVTLARRNELLSLAQQRYIDTVPPVQSATQAMRLNTAQMQNMSFQLNDMTMMLATGASPFVTLTQQGMQMAQIFGPGVGVRGALAATGTALVAFVTNPLNLAVLGLASAAGAATMFFQTLGDESADADQILKRHSDLIRDLKAAYGEAMAGLDDYSKSARSLDVFTAKIRSDVRAQADLLRSEVGDALKAMFIEFASTGQDGAMVFAAGFETYFQTIERLRDQARAGQPDVAAFREEIARIANQNPDSPVLQAIYDRLVQITDEALNAADALREAQGAAGALGRIGTPDDSYKNYVKDAFKTFHPALRAAARERLASDMSRSSDAQRRASRAAAQAEREALREHNEMLSEAASLYTQTRTAAEAYAIEQERLNRLLEGGYISAETYARALDAAREKMEQAEEAAHRMTEAQQFFGDIATASLSSILIHGQDATAVMERLAAAIADAALQAALLGQGPLAELFGTSKSGGFFGTLFSGLSGGTTGLPATGGLWANGGAFSNGNVIPFARGGVVDRPVLFPMAKGAGLMGEAGPEAIMPLRRGPDGRLGVSAAGGGAAGGGAQNVHVTVGVAADGNGNLLPFVQSVAQAEAGRASVAAVSAVRRQFGTLRDSAGKRYMGK